jgi:hypothetical protein
MNHRNNVFMWQVDGISLEFDLVLVGGTIGFCYQNVKFLCFSLFTLLHLFQLPTPLKVNEILNYDSVQQVNISRNVEFSINLNNIKYSNVKFNNFKAYKYVCMCVCMRMCGTIKTTFCGKQEHIIVFIHTLL